MSEKKNFNPRDYRPPKYQPIKDFKGLNLSRGDLLRIPLTIVFVILEFILLFHDKSLEISREDSRFLSQGILFLYVAFGLLIHYGYEIDIDNPKRLRREYLKLALCSIFLLGSGLGMWLLLKTSFGSGRGNIILLLTLGAQFFVSVYMLLIYRIRIPEEIKVETLEKKYRSWKFLFPLLLATTILIWINSR